MGDIYFFNPTCDFAIANGSPNWQPNRLLQKMEEDLDLLPAYLANADDTIILYKHPSASFINEFQKTGFRVPGFLFKAETVKTFFPGKPIHRLKPWGWSPVAHKQFENLKPFCSEDFKKSPVYNWQPEIRKFYSREFSAGILSGIVKSLNDEHFLPQVYLPVICKTEEDVENALKKWGNIMLKAPWSSSGRGLQPITKIPVHSKVWEKIKGIIREQGFVMAEPLLHKVHDLAFLFELENMEICFKGISHFFTDKKGQYAGNYINGLPDIGFQDVSPFLNKLQDKIVKSLIETLQNSELPKYYEGVFGVDMLIYKDIENKFQINPCLEINLRFTMGFLALKLEKAVAENKKGVFRTYFDPQKSFLQFSNEMKSKFPLDVSNGKINSGYLSLNEPLEKSQFGAYLW
jgi:hypothetical protein